MSLSIVKHLSTQEALVNKIWLQGMVLRGVCYGIVVALAFSCIHLLGSKLAKATRAPGVGRTRWLLAYVVFLLTLSSAAMALEGVEMEKAYMFHSDYPGGPAAFVVDDTSTMIIGEAVCFVLLQWASDGLLVWRCFAFFSVLSSRVTLIKTVLLVIMFFNIGLSIVFVACVSSPTSFGSLVVVHGFVLAYGLYTMLLNAGITAAIVTKLLRHRRSVVSDLGTESRTGYYLAVISILVESAAIIVVYDIFYLIPAGIGHPLSLIGRQIGIMVQVCTTLQVSTLVLASFLTGVWQLIPPLMIIQRVARGTAWSTQKHHSEISGTMSSGIEFAEKA